MQQIEANQLDVSINKMREMVQQLRKQQGQKDFSVQDCPVCQLFPGRETPPNGLLESTPRGNLSISVDCSFHDRLSGGLAKTKVIRKARQVPALYPIFKGFAFRFWFF